MTPLQCLNVFLQIIVLFLVVIASFFDWLLSLVFPKARKDIRGQIALVTGAGSGIGRVIAEELASEGVTVVSWDVNEKGNYETEKILKNKGCACHTYTVNLCDRDAIYEAAKRVKEEVGKVDILVNNAGVVTGRDLLSCSDESILRTFEVNTLSHFWTIKAFLPDMKKEDKGHIVTIASLAGIFGINQLVDYCSSKFGAVGLDGALRLELYNEDSNVDTTVVCPNFINTGMFAGAKGSSFPMLEPRDVGKAVVEGIIARKLQIILPKYLLFHVMLRDMLSLRLSLYIGKMVGAFESMNGFIGRKRD